MASSLLVFLFLTAVTAVATMQAQAVRHMYGMGLNTDGQLGLFNTYAPNPVLSQISKCGSSNTFSIALTTDNKLFGFGDNSESQIGMITPMNIVPTPIEITSFASQGITNVTFRSISVGSYHTLAVAQDGRVFGFGSNIDGQIGAGKNIESKYPVHISFLDNQNITQVFAIGSSSFALSDTGNLWAWGANNRLQLGLPPLAWSEPYYSPSQVVNTSDVKTVVGGAEHTFVIFVDGTIYGMGANDKGQLGLGFNSTEESFAPIDPLNDLQVEKIFAGGKTTFVLTDSNELYVFGDNTYSSTGLGSAELTILTPTKVESLGTSVSTVSVGQRHTLVATNDGRVYGAGQNNRGQLGLFPSTTSASNFTQVPGLGQVSALFTGVSYSAALLPNGTLWTWGEILYTGMGSTLNVPTISKFETPYSSIFAGADFSLGLEDPLGYIWGWGNNALKPLTSDGFSDRYEHIKIPTLDGVNITQLAIGGDGGNNYHIISAAGNSTFYVWGNNHKNQLGLSSTSKYLVPFANSNIVNKTFSMLGAGEVHSISLSPDFLLSGWGSNEEGQLGLGPLYPIKIRPVSISEGRTVVSAAAGYKHTIYATSTGEVYAMGDNTYGQLGLPLNATHPYFYSAQLVPLDVNATAVFAGGRCSFIVAEDGSLYAMGDNSLGTLGIANTTLTKVDEPTLVNITIDKPGVKSGTKEPLKVASSKFNTPGHTLVLSSGGEVWVFGNNANGQLGVGETTGPLYTPVKLDLSEEVLDVAVGKDFSLLLAGNRPCPGACSNRGYCDGVIGSCRCHTGYFGERCEFITCEDKQNCNEPNGVCDYTTGFCSCTEKYTGNSCELRSCPNNCSNNGECDYTTGNCKCDDGWTGDDCATEVSGAPPQAMLGVAAAVVSTAVFLALA